MSFAPRDADPPADRPEPARATEAALPARKGVPMAAAAARVPTTAAAARAVSTAAARVTTDAVPSKKSRPRFFEVDSVPPPSIRAEPPRNSAHDDLRVLMATVTDRRPRRPDADLTALSGALFADAPPRPPGVPADLMLLLPGLPGVVEDGGAPAQRSAPMAPVINLDRVARSRVGEAETSSTPLAEAASAPEPPVAKGRAAPVPLKWEHPPIAASAAPEIALVPFTPTYVPRSGAPGPLVSERRSALSAAARRSGVATWAVAVASVSAVAIVVALRFGAASPPDPVTSEAAPPDRGTVSHASPPAATTSPAEPPPSTVEAAPASPAPTAAAVPAVASSSVGSRHEAGAQRAVEPARTVVEHAPVTTAEAPKPTAPPAPPPAAAGGGDFNVAAARAALARAAGAAAGCKQATDPSGGGRVSVTFAPSGRAMSAQVVGPPFQGTLTGACIAATFRTASVPPFVGDPVVVTKEVTLR
jgi:hypothetical protein